MKQFEISEELANKVLQYLATRPYLEVAELISNLQQIKPISEQSKTENNNGGDN
jgi:hypothetical protein